MSKIFDNYNSQEKAGLDFREFVCCFSVCTKSPLKDRMCAIIHTFQDRNKEIKYYSFDKLINNLSQISPPEIEEMKEAFTSRMSKYFSGQKEYISINELYILLNDDFINELTLHIKSDAPNIIQHTIDAYNTR